MNTKVEREENDDINHQARHAIKMTQDWINKPFQLDPIPKTIIFHAQADLVKGRGKKVTIPTFVAQSPIRPEIVYQLDQLVGYYHPPEKKGKGKRRGVLLKELNQKRVKSWHLLGNKKKMCKGQTILELPKSR